MKTRHYLYINLDNDIMTKKIIRLTESDLHNIVYDSVYQILEQRQIVNEGWKNLAMAGMLGAATMFGNPQTVDAQNYVFNSIKDPNEVTGQKFDELLLDANKPISYNYDLIKKRISQHREKNYAEYIIWCKGRYTNKRGQTCDGVDIDRGMIHIKGRDNERYYTIDGQIIRTLTNLYAQSLDDKFDVSPDELQWCNGHDYRTVDVPVFTIRTNGKTSGTVYRKDKEPRHLVYSLSEGSPVWNKIYNKVIEETGLKDGGSMYDLRKNKVSDSVVEKMPSFPGGQAALKQWIDSNKKYPIIASENEVQGRVIIQFMVEEDGSVTNVQVAKSVDPSLDKEAMRIVKSMPKWIPAKQNGSPVRCKYTVPINFVLNK